MKLQYDVRVNHLCDSDRALLLGTIHLLADASPQLAIEFVCRVIPPGCRLARVVSYEYADDLKPFAKLLCYELRWLVQQIRFTPEMQMLRAREVFELTGFIDNVEEHR